MVRTGRRVEHVGGGDVRARDVVGQIVRQRVAVRVRLERRALRQVGAAHAHIVVAGHVGHRHRPPHDPNTAVLRDPVALVEGEEDFGARVGDVGGVGLLVGRDRPGDVAGDDVHMVQHRLVDRLVDADLRQRRVGEGVRRVVHPVRIAQADLEGHVAAAFAHRQLLTHGHAVAVAVVAGDEVEVVADQVAHHRIGVARPQALDHRLGLTPELEAGLHVRVHLLILARPEVERGARLERAVDAPVVPVRRAHGEEPAALAQQRVPHGAHTRPAEHDALGRVGVELAFRQAQRDRRFKGQVVALEVLARPRDFGTAISPGPAERAQTGGRPGVGIGATGGPGLVTGLGLHAERHAVGLHIVGQQAGVVPVAQMLHVVAAVLARHEAALALHMGGDGEGGDRMVGAQPLDGPHRLVVIAGHVRGLGHAVVGRVFVARLGAAGEVVVRPVPQILELGHGIGIADLADPAARELAVQHGGRGVLVARHHPLQAGEGRLVGLDAGDRHILILEVADRLPAPHALGPLPLLGLRIVDHAEGGVGEIAQDGVGTDGVDPQGAAVAAGDAVLHRAAQQVGVIGVGEAAVDGTRPAVADHAEPVQTEGHQRLVGQHLRRGRTVRATGVVVLVAGQVAAPGRQFVDGIGGIVPRPKWRRFLESVPLGLPFG